MSAVARTLFPPAGRTGAVASSAVDGALIVAGVAFLLVRPSLATTSPLPVALGFAGLAAASIRRSPAPVATTNPLLPLTMGVMAVAVGRAIALPAAPVRAGVVVIALNTIAAVGEEAFFRRFLYGRLERWGPGVAVAGSALAFALVHVPLYGIAAFPVDLGAGLLLSWQRAATGRWSVPAATHALANLLVVIP
jgi:membrane protease YdiL (CAAX protease family)